MHLIIRKAKRDFLKDFIYLFLERSERKEKERGRNTNVWLAPTLPDQGPGLHPNWESNQQSFGSHSVQHSIH